MATTSLIPIIIGVGDVINRSLSTAPSNCIEPLDLMLQAVEKAIDDCFGEPGAKKQLLKENVDSVSVVRNWTWPYKNVCGDVLRGLGAGKKGGKVYMEESDHGGNQPVRLVDEACRRVGRGECRVAVVTGGEALASITAYVAKEGEYPKHWSPPASNPAMIMRPSSVSEMSNSPNAFIV
ncbi:acetyl- acetyltransferase protein [Rutstroemia sp. NJR-2017a BBW]|nr:acetyl- acetyltransferase protein [Rutstroemia sp. NJR-2017a BBW]